MDEKMDGNKVQTLVETQVIDEAVAERGVPAELSAPLPQTKVSPERVKKVVASFNVADSLSILNFGNEAISDITAFSDKVLAKVRQKDIGDAGDLLNQMIGQMKSTKVDEIRPTSFLANLPIIGSVFDTFDKFIQNFETVKGQLDKLVNHLRANEASLGQDLKQLDALYHENLSMLGELDVYIAAGKEILHKMKTEDLVALEAKAKATQDPVDSQNLRDAEQTMLRLEKRVSNLQIARLSALQTAPQIRLSQEGSRMLIEDIQDICHNTIPLWKRQFLIALSNHEKEKTLKITQAVKDYTNQQYVKNAEKLQLLEEEISKNYQRGILDVSTLQRVNEITIDTLNNTLKNYEEGRRLRADAERAISHAEEELKNTLLKAIEH